MPSNCCLLKRTGVFAMILSAFLFSTNTALAKLLASSAYSPFTVLYFRGFCTTVGSSSVLVKDMALPIPHDAGSRRMPAWAFARGLLGACAIGCLYFAVNALPLSEAVTLYTLNPVFANIFARVFLAEHIGIMRCFALAIFISGAVVVSDPSSYGEGGGGSGAWAGRIVAACGSVFSGAALVCARKLGTAKAHMMSQAWWQGVMSMAVAPMAITITGAQAFQQPIDALVFLAMALCAFLGQCGVGFAARRESAGIIGVLWNLDVAFAFFWQAAVFRDEVKWFQVVGALCVVAASCIIVLEGYLASSKQNGAVPAWSVYVVDMDGTMRDVHSDAAATTHTGTENSGDSTAASCGPTRELSSSSVGGDEDNIGVINNSPYGGEPEPSGATIVIHSEFSLTNGPSSVAEGQVRSPRGVTVG